MQQLERVLKTTGRSLPISYVKIGRRARADLGDISSLAESIRTVGLLQPIVVDGNHNLIAGRRRLEAWKQAKPDVGAIPAVVVTDLDDALLRLQAERDENTCRKDMTASELYELGKRIEQLERPKAASRTSANLPGNPTSPIGDVGRVVTKVGPALGMSPRQWSRLKQIGDAAADGDDTATAQLVSIDNGHRSITGVAEERSGRHVKLPSTIGDVRTLPKHGSATRLLKKACEQLDGVAEVLDGMDLAGISSSDAEALVSSLSRSRAVLSRTINQLRSIA